MRDNAATVQAMPLHCQQLLIDVGGNLKILDEEHGDAELMGLLVAELEKLPQQEPGAWVLSISPNSPFTPTSPSQR